ncbi:hypothetical protein GCM10027174_31020 [Salinifilum aidingensis]
MPRPGETLIRVAAAGTSNTGISTRAGWYAKSVDSLQDFAIFRSEDRLVAGGSGLGSGPPSSSSTGGPPRPQVAAVDLG